MSIAASPHLVGQNGSSTILLLRKERSVQRQRKDNGNGCYGIILRSKIVSVGFPYTYHHNELCTLVMLQQAGFLS